MYRTTALALLAAAGCAVYQPERDTTQPYKIRKAALLCADANGPWPDCFKAETRPLYYFRPTVVDAPYEAFWTFVGEQGDTEKIIFKATESWLYAYRTHELLKGADGAVKGRRAGYEGEPVAAWPILDHFDVWYQYSPSTGEQLPVKYEAKERPWYEREFMRVDWGSQSIGGYGMFMGSKLAALLFGEVKTEPVSTHINDLRNEPEAFIFDYAGGSHLDLLVRETHTPWVIQQGGGLYLASQYQQLAAAQVTYRYSFVRAPASDYVPFYYPDPVFEKFGFFRTERLAYDRSRGTTDFKDYLMNRWNIWKKWHTDKSCTQHADCGDAAKGETCDFRATEEAQKGVCTLAYEAREVKPIVYYLSPEYPEKLREEGCRTVQSWNEAMKETIAATKGISYTPRDVNAMTMPGVCKFTEAPAGTAFDPVQHDAFVLKDNALETVCYDRNGAEVDCNPKDKTQTTHTRWKYRIGDLRYSMLYYVNQAGTGTPLGYGPSAADPETGEIIQGNAFIYGGALDTYRGFVGDVFDLVAGNLTEDQVRTGDNVREAFEAATGNVFPPTVPQSGFLEDPAKLEQFREALSDRQRKIEELDKLGPSALGANMRKLAGTDIEQILTDNDEFRIMMGIPFDQPMDEHTLDVFSPFREGWELRKSRQRQLDRLLSENCVMHANTFIDYAVTHLVETARSRGLSREQAVDWILARIYRGVTEHELGHTMGLRHNFEGSFDEENYFPLYWEIKQKFPDPRPEEFGTLPLNAAQLAAYNAARLEKKKLQQLAGIKQVQYSSIMDYGGQFYSDLAGIGRYDVAAMKFGYGNLHEVYDGAPNAQRTNRINETWYLGGEECAATNPCPYAAAGQLCVARGAKNLCTSWEEDAARDATAHPLIPFRFCSDERTDDRPFCNRFDEGPSSTEIVENLIDTYERNYIFNNFRRYRYYFGFAGYFGRIWDRYFYTMGKQYASLLYQAFYNQAAILSSGRGSFGDMLQASVTAMNFFNRVMGTPDVGGYSPRILDTVTDDQNQPVTRHQYVRTSRNCENGDLHICLGLGKHFYSVWETGYYGQLYRTARIGAIIDKILAMEALTTRAWGNPSANDETYPLSFYDAFPEEMIKLFSGLISRDPSTYAPVVRSDPNAPSKKLIVYRDLWTGEFFGQDPGLYSYAGSPTVKIGDDPFTRHRLDDVMLPEGLSFLLQTYALIYSLANFTVWFDTSYADYLQIYQFGGPEVRFPEDGDRIISYTSPFREVTYYTIQTIDKRSVIYPLIVEARALRDQWLTYTGWGTSPPAGIKGQYPECAPSYIADDKACQQVLINSTESELRDRDSFLSTVFSVRKALGFVQ